MSAKRSGWTVLLVRQDGTGSHTLRVRRPLAVLGISLVLTACLALGTALGRYWEASREGGRVAALEAEVARLEAERARVAELESKLETIESGYRRIRRAMGGEVAASERDVLLPPLAAELGASRSSVDESPLLPTAWPLAQRGFVTRSFGSFSELSSSGHPGIDIAVPLGSYVRASGAGIVAEAGRDSVYGYYVRIAHVDGFSSLYGHNSWLFVMEGDSVGKLQVIALSGNTGRSTAPHLHFEIERGGDVVDPLGYVPLGG